MIVLISFDVLDGVSGLVIAATAVAVVGGVVGVTMFPDYMEALESVVPEWKEAHALKTVIEDRVKKGK